MQLPVQKTLACKEKKVVYGLHDSIDSVTFVEWLEWKFIIVLSESAAFFHFQKKNGFKTCQEIVQMSVIV